MLSSVEVGLEIQEPEEMMEPRASWDTWMNQAPKGRPLGGIFGAERTKARDAEPEDARDARAEAARLHEPHQPLATVRPTTGPEARSGS